MVLVRLGSTVAGKRTLLPRRWFGRGAFRAINVPGDFRASTNIGAMQTKALPISTPPTLNAKSCKEA